MELNHPIIPITILSLIPICQSYDIPLSSSNLKAFFAESDSTTPALNPPLAGASSP